MTPLPANVGRVGQAAADVLAAARAVGATVYLDAGELRVRAAAGLLSDDLRQNLREHRDGVAAIVEIEELVAELAHAREWAAAHDLLPAGQPTGSEFLAKAMSVAAADPHRALVAARRHYHALVEECELLPLADAAPQAQVGAA